MQERIAQTKRAKYTFEYVKSVFSTFSYELISTAYFSSKDDLDVKCNLGHIHQVTFNNFLRGTRCPHCLKASQRLSIEFVRQQFELENYTLLSTHYQNNAQKLNVICSQNHHTQISYNKFKSGRRCNKCSLVNRSGARHYNFNSNLTEEIRNKKRDVKEVVQWRKEVFKKDNFHCRKCGIKNKSLNAHHIHNWADYPQLRFNVDNGITLCLKCHNLFHLTYGVRNNNQNEIDDFLRS